MREVRVAAPELRRMNSEEFDKMGYFGLWDLCRRYPSSSIFLGIGSAYLTYYLIWVVKKPQLACNSHFEGFLKSHCPILTENYWPTWWCIEAKSQTIIRSVLKSFPKLPYQKEFLYLDDGGHVALDWLENDTKSKHPRETRPTVLILPGLTGSSQESYALHFAQQTVTLGYRCIVFNYRGFGGAELKTARTYSAASTEDLSAVIKLIKTRYPDAPLLAVGISLGGLILTNFLAKNRDSEPLVAAMAISAAWNVYESTKTLENKLNTILFNRHLTENLKDNIKSLIVTNYLAKKRVSETLVAAMAVSPAWNMFEAANSLERFLNKLILNRHLTWYLKESVKRNEHFFKDGNFDLAKIYQSQTIREFDHHFTSRQFGYPGYKEYYDDACIHKKVHQIRVPLLCLNASDDPFSPEHAIPMVEACRSKCVAIVQTSHGGHIGFLEGLFPRHESFMDRLFAQYIAAIFENLDDIGKLAV